MFCYNCGFKVDAECRFCPQCGVPLGHMHQESDPGQQEIQPAFSNFKNQAAFQDPAYGGTNIAGNTTGTHRKRWIVPLSVFTLLVILLGAFIFIKFMPDPVVGTWQVTELVIDGTSFSQDDMSEYEVFNFTMTLNRDKSLVYTYNHNDGSTEVINGKWDKESKGRYNNVLFPDSGPSHGTATLKGDRLELKEDVDPLTTIIYSKR